jgi:hypothetical protein
MRLRGAGHGDDRAGQDVGKRALARLAFPGAADPGYRHRADLAVADALADNRFGLQAHIQRTAPQMHVQALGGIDGQFDFQCGMRLLDGAEEVHQPSVNHCFHHTDAQPAGESGIGLHGGLHLPPRLQNPVGVFQQQSPRCGQPHLAHLAIEEAFTEIVFKRRDAGGNGGLREIQPLRRFTEAVELRDPDEGFEEPCVHHLMLKRTRRKCSRKVTG